MQVKEPTEVFLLLHEHTSRPIGREYEYMVGDLRREIEAGAFGEPISEEGMSRLTHLGAALRGVNLSAIVTENFAPTRASAEVLSKAASNGMSIPIEFDGRVCESDLSYLDRDRFDMLGRNEHKWDPNAALRDWMRACPNDVERVVSEHVSLWNDMLQRYDGKKFVLVLHVEGVLLLAAMCLGLPAMSMASLHIPRGCPLHVRLHPKVPAVLSIDDFAVWRDADRKPTPFAQYG